MDERYLPNLSEECAEVVVAVCKAQRFGLDDSHPDYRDGKVTNREAIIDEAGDVLGVLASMHLTDAEKNRLNKAKAAKIKKLKIYGPEGTYLAADSGVERKS